MKKSPNPIWIDIETGGINPSESSILSAAWGEAGKVKTKFAAPIEGTLLSEFSEKNIIPQLHKAINRGQDIIEEKQLIETLIKELQVNKGAAIAGFNIRGFDLGFIQRRARVYGLEAKLVSALAGREIIDPIHQVKGIIATTIMQHAEGGLFNQALGASSWQEATEKYRDLPFHQRPVEFNLISSIEGYLKSGREKAQFKGWKLEDINTLLEMHSGKSTLHGSGIAHEAAADLVMTKRVAEAAKSGELRKALEDTKIATEWLNITKSRGFHQFSKSQRLLTQADIGSLAPGKSELKLIKSNWKLAIGVGAAAIIGASVFSAHDDNYNTIEGLPHGNFAQSKRLELTSFGSGWRGIEVNEEIASFRDNVWSDPEQKSAIKKLIAEEQAATQAELGSLKESEYSIRSGNFKGSAAKAVASVDLDNFNIEVEDADTLILKRRGLLNFFDNPIQVRLAGIDAPEVGGHGSDPLSIIRFAQDQPYGDKATSRLQEIIEEAKNLSLVVTGEKTYGRYLGALTDGNNSIAEQLVSEGMVTALPFGKAESDLLNRRTLDKAQEQAIQEERGLWSLSRYKFVNEVNQYLENPITHNTLTRLDKLAEGQALAAYASRLESFGSRTDQLTAQELFESKGIGRALAAFFKPRMSGKDDAHNTIEGLGHKGIAWQKRQSITEFGSGYKPKLTLAHIKELATKASKSSVADFFKSIKVNRPDEVLKPIVDQFGGGLTIDLKQLKRLDSFQPKSLLGFNRVIEEGQPKFAYQTWREKQENLIKQKVRTGSFVSYDSAEVLSELTGVSLPKSFEAIDDIDKIVGFHEAAELQNIRSIPTSVLKSELFNGGPAPAHAMSVVQEELFSRSLHPEARDFMKQVRKVTDSWFSGYDDIYNTNEGLRHSGLSEPLRKLLTDFGSGWQGTAGALRRAERLYKSTIKATLRESGYKGKIDWISYLDEDTGEMVLAARNAKGERLLGVQRTFAKDNVDLTSIEIAESFQGGTGRKFYEYENRVLKRLGFAGAEVTSPVANPVTGRMQAELYGSKPMSIFHSDIESAYGVNPEEFQEMLMNKQMTKDQWKTVGLAPTFSGKISAPTVKPIMSGKDDAHNTIEGLNHRGISQKLRKLLTPFGSGWRGIISLSSKMDLGKYQKARGLVADVGTLQEIWQSNVTRLKSLHGKDWWKTDAGRATHKFGKELIQAKEAGFTHVAGINTEVIRESAKKSNLDFGNMLKHTIEHERVHLGMRLEGTRVSKNLPVPQAFKIEMAKNPAYKDISPEKLAEEYVANLSAVMKYPERAIKDQRVRSSIVGATTEEIARSDIVAKNIANKLKAQRKKNMIAFNQKKALGETWQAGIDAGRRSKMG